MIITTWVRLILTLYGDYFNEKNERSLVAIKKEIYKNCLQILKNDYCGRWHGYGLGNIWWLTTTILFYCLHHQFYWWCVATARNFLWLVNVTSGWQVTVTSEWQATGRFNGLQPSQLQFKWWRSKIHGRGSHVQSNNTAALYCKWQKLKQLDFRV